MNSRSALKTRRWMDVAKSRVQLWSRANKVTVGAIRQVINDRFQINILYRGLYLWIGAAFLLAGCVSPSTSYPEIATNAATAYPAVPTSALTAYPGISTATATTQGTPVGTPTRSGLNLTTTPITIAITSTQTITMTPSPIPFSLAPTPTPPAILEIPEPIMGVESHSMNSTLLSAFQNAGLEWTRRNAILWSDVEPVEGQRNWAAVASLEKDLASSASQGIHTILVVRSTPAWAQRVAGHLCGPIRQDKFEAFASFMKDLVNRYSAAPYLIKYWELWNEPDVDPSLVPADNIFGCWGDQNDDFYGGKYYAQMLKVVYPAIKSADPEAQVLNGGLLLDCDPTHPPQGKDCKPGLFFKGILEGGGADYFDILSFHGYSLYNGSWYNAELSGTWLPRGGSVIGKVSYLREVMNQYQVDKPIFQTEGSLTCSERNVIYCNPPGDQFFDDQASYTVYLFVRNWAAGIAATEWYDFEGPGWRYGSMLDGQQKPKPDYLALTFLLKELKGAKYRREVLGFQNLKVYEFGLPDKRVWVMWPTDGQSHALIPPGDSLQVLDKFGGVLSPTGSSITFTSPIYIELKP